MGRVKEEKELGERVGIGEVLKVFDWGERYLV